MQDVYQTYQEIVQQTTAYFWAGVHTAWGSSLFIVGVLVFIRWWKRKTTIQTCQRLYDFDTNELMIEINRREKLTNSFRMVCIVSSERPAHLKTTGQRKLHPEEQQKAKQDPQMVLKHGLSTKRLLRDPTWIRVEDKLRMRKGRTKLKGLEVNFGLRFVYYRILVILLLLLSIAVTKMLILQKVHSDSAELGSAIDILSRLYTKIISIEAAVVHLLLRGDSVQFGKMMVITFLNQQLSTYKKTIVSELAGVISTSRKTIKDNLSSFWGSSACDMLRRFEVGNLVTLDCDQAMAGIAKKPMMEFLRSYPLLIDELVIRWQSSQTLEAKRQIFTEDRYASMLAYSFYNVLGISGSIYYASLAPLISVMKSSLAQIRPVLNLINIISIPIVIGLLVVASVYVLREMNKVEQFRKAFYVAYPRRLIRANQSLANKLKAGFRV